LGRQHVCFSLIALGAKERVPFHVSRNRVRRNGRQQHGRAALGARRGCTRGDRRGGGDYWDHLAHPDRLALPVLKIGANSKALLALKAARNGLNLAAAGIGERHRGNSSIKTRVSGWPDIQALLTVWGASVPASSCEKADLICVSC
jgi:hypothetical protein